MAALAAVSGCASAQPDTAATPLPKPPAFSGRLSPEALDMVTRSGTWPRAQQTLDTAVNALVHRCMKDKGFTYPATRAALPTSLDDTTAVVDLPGRRRHGYAIATTPRQSGPPPAPYYTDLSPDRKRNFDLAFSGPADSGDDVSTGTGTVRVQRQGCDAEARRDLTGDVTVWARMYYTPEALNGRLDAKVPKAREYTAAMSAWQACMLERGYAYRTPEKARDSLTRRFLENKHRKGEWKEEFRKREKRVAVADGECAIEADVPGAAVRVRQALIATLPKKDRAALAELASYQSEAVKRAEATLGR
ncbi:hypothetical protein ABZV77_13240 [Streptomyces sp. NPDC004732]|uniref:hypothetical protein n=1 Tax=Streptomyces sp. NPDC004732 TaxID=3154290 RepID=UPI0033A3BDAA